MRCVGASTFDAVWWVELAPVREPADVVAALAAVVGVGAAPGLPLVDAVQVAVQRQHTLVVLDNCEHLLDEVARVAAQLLRGAQSVRVLTTSREPLSLDGEFAWAVPTLGVPSATSVAAASAEAVASYDGVQLFVERVRAVTPRFVLTNANAAAIAVICQRLDGLPLALELAAAVVPVLGVDGLATRLDDALSVLSRGKRSADPRHRTLRAVLDWSYELLSDDERRLLNRLSVFRGAFPLDAIEFVCVEPGVPVQDKARAVMALGRLVEHSLVEVREDGGEATYRLLETVRQYGNARLRETPDEPVIRERHARWITQFSAQCEGLLFTSARGRTVTTLRRYTDEIRAALDWSLSEHGDVALAVRLAGLLGWFWISGVAWSEARGIVHRVLDAHDAHPRGDTEPTVEEKLAVGRLFYPIVGLAYFAGDTDTMLRLTARDEALWLSLDHETLTPAQRLTRLRQYSLGQQLRGIALAMRGQGADSLRCMDHSIALAIESMDSWLLPVMTIRRALVHYYLGDLESARRDYQHAIPLLRGLSEHWFLSLALEGLANVWVALGVPEQALPAVRDAALVLDDERDDWFISRACDTAAWVIANASAGVMAGNVAGVLAAHLLGAGETLRQACGAGIIGPDVQRDGRIRERIQQRIGLDAYTSAVADGMRWSADDALRIIRDELGAICEAVPRERTALELPPSGQSGSGTVAALRVSCLGRFALYVEGMALPDALLPTGKVRELLVYLLLHDDASKEEIALALWPDASAAQVRNIFHVTLHHLRRSLGDQHWVVFEAHRYRLVRASAERGHLEADVDALLAASREARQAVRRQTPVALDRLTSWQLLLESCSGDLLAGATGEEWLTVAQDRVRLAWTDMLDALIQLARTATRHHQVLALCDVMLRREPYRESAHRAYMEALGATGEPARALVHYETLVAMLGRELGASPSPETRQVVEALRK